MRNRQDVWLACSNSSFSIGVRMAAEAFLVLVAPVRAVGVLRLHHVDPVHCHCHFNSYHTNCSTCSDAAYLVVRLRSCIDVRFLLLL